MHWKDAKQSIMGTSNDSQRLSCGNLREPQELSPAGCRQPGWDFQGAGPGNDNSPLQGANWRILGTRVSSFVYAGAK